jgi:hypothetical protein
MFLELPEERPMSLKAKAAVCVGLAALLIGAIYLVVTYRLTLKGQDGCFTYRSIPALELVAVDVSDPLLPANRQRAEAALQRVLKRLPEGGRLIILPLGSDIAAEPVATFNKCAPARLTDLNPITSGRRPGAGDRLHFEKQARESLWKAVDQPDARTSPLVERLAVLVTFPPYLENVSGPRGLNVFTDGIQNSEVSFYHGLTPLPVKDKRLLHGWSVDFVFTTNRRDQRLQTAPLRALWQSWAKASGAGAIRIEAAGLAPTTPQG